MSVRSVLILSTSKEDFGKILFYRSFPTVEKRCKILHGKEYVGLPAPPIFVNNLLTKLGLSLSSKQFVEWRDKASSCMQLPVIDVRVNDNEIWPVLSISQQSLVVCCLPFVEKTRKHSEENLWQIPSLSVGFSVILGILNFFGTKSYEEKMSNLLELDSLLTLSMPFGVPSDMELSCAANVNNFIVPSFAKKQPAWKPIDFKGKQQILIKISEFVRCMQSNQKNKSLCHYEVFGQISVRADLEGAHNDVTLSVSSSNLSRPLVLDSVLLHPCIQIHGATTSASAPNFLRRLRFSPPLHEFILLQYCSPELKEPPFLGVFKMLGETFVELLIQLKLSTEIKNSFDYCDVIVVFFNRGPVRNFDFNTNHGAVRLSDDKHSLKWNLGTKFPKDLEVALTAKLDFLNKPILPDSDPFCIDKNCYAQVNFKQNNSTLSGCNVEQKSIVVSQANKVKIIIEKSFQSMEYRLWNNYGDLPFPVDVTEKFEKLSINL